MFYACHLPPWANCGPAKTRNPIQVGTRVSWRLQGLVRTVGQKDEGVGALSLSHWVS